MSAAADVDVLGDENLDEGRLAALCFLLEDVQKVRIGAGNRGYKDEARNLKLEEDRIGRLIKREFESHPMYDWLPNGLRGPKTAMLLTIIRDPLRFRNKSALQSYLGLGVVHGRAQRKVKGVRAKFNVRGKTVVLGPLGIADQIVLHRVQPYRDIYDAERARLLSMGGDGSGSGNAGECEAAPTTQSGHDEDYRGDEAYAEVPARKTGREDAIARKIAAKRFLRDLLAEWKNRCGDDRYLGDDASYEAA